VRDDASVIVASGDAAVRAAQQATKTIPIIAVVDDIVAAGLIDSLAKSSAQYHGGVRFSLPSWTQRGSTFAGGS